MNPTPAQFTQENADEIRYLEDLKSKDAALWVASKKEKAPEFVEVFTDAHRARLRELTNLKTQSQSDSHKAAGYKEGGIRPKEPEARLFEDGPKEDVA